MSTTATARIGPVSEVISHGARDTARPHLLPVPDPQPPYDDAAQPVRHQRDSVQGTLALAFVLPSGAPTTPSHQPALRLLPAPAAAVDAHRTEDEVDFGPQPTSTLLLPDVRSWAGRFVQAVVEVLAGDRPVGQLVRWTSTEVYDDLATRVAALSRRQAGAQPRAVVGSVHVAVPVDGVAEVAALVRRGARSAAVAVRLEGLDGRWQCTALHLG